MSVKPIHPIQLMSLHSWTCLLVGVGGEAEGSALALANATAVGELLDRDERARLLWTPESGLLLVAISSTISGIVHLAMGAIRS